MAESDRYNAGSVSALPTPDDHAALPSATRPSPDLALRFVLQDIIKAGVCVCGKRQAHAGWMVCAAREATRLADSETPNCRSGKRRFNDESAAKRALAAAVSAPNRRAREIRYYQCKFCDGWHLTSQVRLA